MSARIESTKPIALLGGGLVMLGAWLPWLTLFAGLQRYGGFTGVHGRILFVGGAVAIVAVGVTLCTRRQWMQWGTVLLGVLLLSFTSWLLVRLVELLRHSVDTMLVPRAGPGLFVSFFGAALIVVGSMLRLIRGHRQQM